MVEAAAAFDRLPECEVVVEWFDQLHRQATRLVEEDDLDSLARIGDDLRATPIAECVLPVRDTVGQVPNGEADVVDHHERAPSRTRCRHGSSCVTPPSAVDTLQW
jgi:hypothetical protein